MSQPLRWFGWRREREYQTGGASVFGSCIESSNALQVAVSVVFTNGLGCEEQAGEKEKPESPVVWLGTGKGN